MQAKNAINLLHQLAEQSDNYRQSLEKTIIPALKKLPSDQEVDCKFFIDKPAPELAHLSHLTKTDWMTVLISANEEIANHNVNIGLTVENELTSKIREWLEYEVNSRRKNKSDQVLSGRRIT